MARDILGEYGPNTSKPQRARAECGGILPGDQRDVMNYKPPQGPIGIMKGNSVGLGGVNHGNGQRSSANRGSGSPGLGGTNKGITNRP